MKRFAEHEGCVEQFAGIRVSGFTGPLRAQFKRAHRPSGPYRPSCAVLYKSTKSAIATGHFSFLAPHLQSQLKTSTASPWTSTSGTRSSSQTQHQGSTPRSTRSTSRSTSHTHRTGHVGEYRASIKGMWQTWSMLLLFVSILNIFVDLADFLFATDSESLFSVKAQIPHPMPTRASGRPGLIQALGFKCIICNAEFATRRGADYHRRHPACSGTACADPSNMRSVSLTAQSDVSVGLLRQHSAAPLGTCVILHRKKACSSRIPH